MIKHGDTLEMQTSTDNEAEQLIESLISESVALRLALADKDIENETLRNENITLKEQLSIDETTSCKTERYLNEYMSTNNGPGFGPGEVAVVYADVVGLGEKNNHYGHAFGDKVLAIIGGFLNSELGFREGDVVAYIDDANFSEHTDERNIISRPHGDEFVIICRNLRNDPEFEKNLQTKIAQIAQDAAKLTATTDDGKEVKLSLVIEGKVRDSNDKTLFDTQNRANLAMNDLKMKQKENKNTGLNLSGVKEVAV